MSYEQLELILRAITIVIILFVTNFIEPYIKSKISVTELAKLENYIRTGVRCAEQIYTPEQWAEKKAYVLSHIKALIGEVVKLDLTDEQIDTLIEGIVYEVKKDVKGK